ncbi:MAG TPA: hypothetical protein VK694_01530 [Verrucomicrobiae bacterium]|nr:hypothetical protein [Verrucomicrobiae bacterium]
MKHKLKKLIAGLSLLILILVPAMTAHAQFNSIEGTCSAEGVPTGDEAPTLCKDNEADQAVEGNSIYGADGILTKVARIMSILVGIASVIVIIIGGFKYVLAAGDTTSIASAKNTIMYAVVGLVVSLVSQGIITFVLLRVR